MPALSASPIRQRYAITLVFYAVLVGAGIVVRGLHFGDWGYLDDLQLPAWPPMVAAIGGAVAVLLISKPLMRFAWATRIADMVREVFGTPTMAQALLLGLASGIAEEFLFRGALQPWLGPIVATLLFAILHAVGWWWVFALVMGGLLAALYEWSGNLWPCIAAHVIINSVNLYRTPRWAGEKTAPEAAEYTGENVGDTDAP